MITSYSKIKKDVLGYYQSFLEIAQKAEYPQNDTSMQSLALQAEKIKDDRFCLMVAGEAKSGKSTFINAYLGTEILPMDVRQCTSSIVEIRYGQEFRLTATYADGHQRTFTGEKSIREFLTENAALDDEYRDIPVTTINNEIIVKYKGKQIPKQIIQDLLAGVKRENIHRLPEEKYNAKIIKYIDEKNPHWRDIVVKIDIEYPFESKDMRGIRIIDSPGVNAAGRVGDVTAEYIESADAIMFLRPITGVAIEANSFKEFLESKSVDRNKNAMFLILTRSSSESEETIQRACEEFYNMFGSLKTEHRQGILKDQIIPVDSKAELYYNMFYPMTTEEIKSVIKKMNEEKKLEAFVKVAWYDSDGNKDAFLAELKKYSNFKAIDKALNTLGRKAQYIALSEFLGRILKVYAKIALVLRERIKNYQLKAEDPRKLEAKLKATENELRDIVIRMSGTAKEILSKYGSSGNKGLIGKRAEEVLEAYRSKIMQLDSSNESIDALERLSFQQIDKFTEFESQLQKNVVAECDTKLKVALSDKKTVEFVSLEPDFSREMVEKIKEDMKKESYEPYTYTTGRTFKTTHTGSRFSQKIYFAKVRDGIDAKLENIKNDVVRDLTQFVSRVINAYTHELWKNADAKKAEIEKIVEDKRKAEQIQILISDLSQLVESIAPNQKAIEELKGGIDSNV